MATPPRPAPPSPAIFGWPWLDRGGRFSPFKAFALLLVLLPGAFLAWQFGADELGPEPVVALEHGTGSWAVRLLLVGLLVTPLRHLADWPRAVLLRRMLGLAALGYALVHLLLYVAVEHFRLLHVAGEILRRPYLTVGFAALLVLVVLGVTSTDRALRRMGARWKTLHRLVFPATALALVHFFLQSKVDVSEAVLCAGLFLWLAGWRQLPAALRARPVALMGLAAAAALLTAALEYGWYALFTGVPARRVLLANLDVAFGPRPAVWVGIAGLGAALLPPVARMARWLRGRFAGPPPPPAAGTLERRARRRAAAAAAPQPANQSARPYTT